MRSLPWLSLVALLACRNSSDQSAMHTSRAVPITQPPAVTAACQPAPTKPPMEVGGDVLPPTVARRIDPVLEPGLRLKKAGPIIFRVVVGESGAAEYVEVLRDGTEPELGTRYVEAVKRWRFLPATLRGCPVKVNYTLSVNIDVR